MLKQIAILTALAGCIQAQTILADIPFDFQAGGVERAAGIYSFRYSDTILNIQSAERRVASITVAAERADRRDDSNIDVGVEFVRYGGRIFLSGGWVRQFGAYRLVAMPGGNQLRRVKRGGLVVAGWKR